MRYKIVGDSSTDVTKEMEALYNISIAPLSFTLDGIEYIDDDNLDLNHYLDMVDQSKNVPKSACPSLDDYISRFEGPEEWVFGITISSELSGSYNSAMTAKDIFLEDHPDKKIHIFDSKGASTMQALIAIKIAELAEEGKVFDEIVMDVENYIRYSHVLFVLDKIDTLEKNGRLSGMKAKIVRALNLKLILMATPEGAIDMADKARGTKKALKKMVLDMGNVGSINQNTRIAISHCKCPERAEYVKQLIEETYDSYKEIIILTMRGLSSTYANVGGIIISF